MFRGKWGYLAGLLRPSKLSCTRIVVSSPVGIFTTEGSVVLTVTKDIALSGKSVWKNGLV